MKLTRREIFGAMGGLMAGTVLSNAVTVFSADHKAPPDTYWSPQKLNKEEAAQIAYGNFFIENMGAAMELLKAS